MKFKGNFGLYWGKEKKEKERKAEVPGRNFFEQREDRGNNKRKLRGRIILETDTAPMTVRKNWVNTCSSSGYVYKV